MSVRYSQVGSEVIRSGVSNLHFSQVGAEIIYRLTPPLPAKATSLTAYYQTGWFGNDTPDTMKMFRFGHLVSSSTGFKLTAFIVDDETYTFANPLVIPLKIVEGNKYAVNRKGRRMSILIEFPPADGDFTILEHSVSYLPSSQR